MPRIATRILILVYYDRGATVKEDRCGTVMGLSKVFSIFGEAKATARFVYGRGAPTKLKLRTNGDVLRVLCARSQRYRHAMDVTGLHFTRLKATRPTECHRQIFHVDL
jgi:hypothetical protein